MSEAKHTAGPWKWAGVPGESDLVNEAGENVMKHDSYEGLWFSRYNEEDGANALLMSAAPDLYAFAEEVRRRCIEMGMPGHELCTLAEAAISKAGAQS